MLGDKLRLWKAAAASPSSSLHLREGAAGILVTYDD